MLGLSRLIHQFSGGINPPAHKQESLQATTQEFPPVAAFHIPYQTIDGNKLKLRVKEGDQVMRGELLNQPTDVRHLYAPVSGTVGKTIKILISGRIPYYSLALVIHNDYQYTRYPTERIKSSWSKQWIRQAIGRANIYGMGGGGFPTIHKLQAKHIHSLLVNAAECEPYITADHALLNTHSHEVMQGIAIVHSLLDLKHIIIGIENNMTSAVEALEHSLEDAPAHTKIQLTESIYPIGSEKQLIKQLFHQEVPSGKRPADVGILCLNVATLRAIYRAVEHGEPLLERIITITGSAIRQPANYWVRLGTPIKMLLQQTAQRQQVHARVGGNMMGYPVQDDNMPVSASTNCILVSDGTTSNSEIQRECIRCGLCEEVCPVDLLPQQLYRSVKADKMDLARQQGLFDCIECAACDYVCPSKLPLSRYFVYAKEDIKQEDEQKRKAAIARQRYAVRDKRIAEQKALREQKRRARMAAMKQAAADSDMEKKKERKLAVLKIQIHKTQQAIDKWEESQLADKQQKLSPLYEGLKKLQQEYKDLDGGSKGDPLPHSAKD